MRAAAGSKHEGDFNERPFIAIWEDDPGMRPGVRAGALDGLRGDLRCIASREEIIALLEGRTQVSLEGAVVAAGGP